MIKQAEDGLFDLIITKEISRFARNTLDSLKYTRMLKNWGIGVIFLNDNINTIDADSELRLTIMSCIAQEESRKTSDRVKWGQRRQMEKGVVFGGDILGYRRENGKIIVDETEAYIVRQIFKKYCGEKKGLYTIAKELEDSGYRTKKGLKKWNNASVSRILKNEKYTGDLKQRKTYTTDYLTHEKRINKGEEEFIILRDHHEAIVDRDTFAKAQSELLKRNQKAADNSKYTNRYVFSGKIKCGECGAFFVARKRKRKVGYKLYWQCLNSCKYGKVHKNGQGDNVGCNNTTLHDETLRKIFADYTKHIAVNSNEIVSTVLKSITRAIKQTDKKSESDTSIKRELDNITRKKYEIIDLLLENKISKEDMLNIICEYERKINTCNSILAQPQTDSTIPDKHQNTVPNLKNTINKIVNGEIFSDEVCRELLDCIHVYPNPGCEEKKHKIEISLIR